MVYKLEFVIVTFGIRLHFHNALQSGLLLSHNQRDFIDVNNATQLYLDAFLQYLISWHSS